MKKLFSSILILGSVNTFAEVECKSFRTDKDANKVTQDHINNFCDTKWPFSISDSSVDSSAYGNWHASIVSTRVCCFKKVNDRSNN
jgi:hypothetical protein